MRNIIWGGGGFELLGRGRSTGDRENKKGEEGRRGF